MTDRAEWLCYRVSGTPKTNTYENSAFRVEITDSLATFYPTRDLSSLEQAEQVIDEFLRSFEADRIFQGGEPVTFRFERGQMKSGMGKFVGLSGTITVAGPRAEANIREQSPWRRPEIAESPAAGALVERYEQYKSGRDKLTTVAYVCLSALQQEAGGRKQAARNFHVALEVLNRIGELSSNYGGLSLARKLNDQSQDRVLTSSEVFWLEAAIRAIIARLYEVESGVAQFSEITMRDLPLLPSPA